MNPIDVLFGRNVITILRNRPDSIKRIANAAKPVLMAVLHPDVNPDLGQEAAASISEAHAILSQASSEEIKSYVTRYLSSPGREVTLKTRIQDLNRLLEAKEKQLKAAIAEIANRDAQLEIKQRGAQAKLSRAFYTESELRQRVETLEERSERALWLWMESDASPKSIYGISRSRLHLYRVVVKYGRSFYKAFEFDLTGKVQRTIVANSLERARVAFLMKGEKDSPDAYRMIKAGKILLGYSKPPLTDVVSDLEDGTIIPYVKIGHTPIFVSNLARNIPSIDVESGGKIVDIVPIRATKRQLFFVTRQNDRTERQKRIDALVKSEAHRRFMRRKYAAQAKRDASPKKSKGRGKSRKKISQDPIPERQQ